MRDFIIVGILASTLPFTFRYVYIGVLLWTWIGIMNPHKLAYGFTHNAPIAAAIGGITLISLFTTKDKVRLLWVPPMVLIVVFFLWTCITTNFAFFPSGSAVQLNKVFKIFLMVLIAAAVLYKHLHIRLFVWVNAVSLGFYGIKGGIHTILSGGSSRVWGPPGGFIEGNNELALALVMAIPLMHFLRLTTPYTWVKRGLLIMMLLSTASAIGTQSRGALLALSAMAMVLWWRAPNKALNAIGVSVVALSIWAFMPSSWHDRMGTIQTYEDDGSAMGRIYAWMTAYNIANDRIFGAGYDMYSDAVFSVYSPESTGRFDASIARAAHSIYFQVLGEHGYIGLLLFLLIWLSAFKVAARLRRQNKASDPETAWVHHLGSMIQVSFAGWAVGGAFLSLAYFDFPYYLVVMLVVAERWSRERLTMPQEVALIPPPAGKRRGFIDKVQWWIKTV